VSVLQDVRSFIKYTEYGNSRWLGEGILGFIECPYVAIAKDMLITVMPGPSIPENRGQIIALLPRLLDVVMSNQAGDTSSVNITSLLWGIERQSLLPYFTEDVHRARQLAGAILWFIDSYDEGFPLDMTVGPTVLDLLNLWIVRAEPWTSLPDVDTAASAFFGAAWWHLFDRERSAEGPSVGSIILTETPDLLPGLCAGSSMADEMLLPQLGDSP
jgi:hypothetical protein